MLLQLSHQHYLVTSKAILVRYTILATIWKIILGYDAILLKSLTINTISNKKNEIGKIYSFTLVICSVFNLFETISWHINAKLVILCKKNG